MMTILEKMNELVGADADKETIKRWAYANRVHVIVMHLDDERFSALEKSVDVFVNSEQFGDDEHENWDKFLDSEFIE